MKQRFFLWRDVGFPVVLVIIFIVTVLLINAALLYPAFYNNTYIWYVLVLDAAVLVSLSWLWAFSRGRRFERDNAEQAKELAQKSIAALDESDERTTFTETVQRIHKEAQTRQWRADRNYRAHI